MPTTIDTTAYYSITHDPKEVVHIYVDKETNTQRDKCIQRDKCKKRQMYKETNVRQSYR